MANKTTSYDAPERAGAILPFTLAASTAIFAGLLVAINAAGNAVQADDVAGLTVIGRAEADADNSSGLAGDLSINAKRGVFLYKNSATNALTKANVGEIAYVEDPVTVASTSTHLVQAGVVVAVEDGGVWIDTTFAAFPAQAAATVVALSSTNGTAAGAADLAALKTEAEHIGDDVRAIHAALVARGILAAG